VSEARKEIFERLRKTLRAGPTPDDTTTPPPQSSHPRGPQPAWTEAPLQRFVAKLEAVAGTLVRVGSRDTIPAAVTGYLETHELPAQLVAAPHPLLESLPWPTTLTLERRAAQAQDIVALSAAFCAVAETGSLALLSGPHTPTTLNFLPDHYLCVVQASRVVSHLEDVWDLLRREHGGMPRALNLITGPSRTADVEQIIQLGAHGPRRLHVILIEDE
jgi:L-lactate dehydrogenase complex protein LldG